MTPGDTARALLVERLTCLVTVQDLGRPGYGHLGVSRSGAADRGALARANRLVGNQSGAAALEVTLGPLGLIALADLTIAVCGATCPVRVGGRPVAGESLVEVDAGESVELGTARDGVRAYLAVRGGLDADVVLGSRATDTLSGLGPRPPVVGDVLPVGAEVTGWPRLAQVPVAALPHPDEVVVLDLLPGPEAGDVLDRLTAVAWTAAPDSDRVAVRLAGSPLVAQGDGGGDAAAGVQPSRPLVRGAVQLPPSGLPVVFGPDYPVTGGYPVVAVLTDASADRAAQTRPGQPVRLRVAAGRESLWSPIHGR